MRITLLALALVVTLWLLLARARPAQAAGVVTNCSNDAQLRAMLSTGGAVSFNCNGNNSPATIVISPAIALGEGNFSLDGGGKVTLSGANTNRIFTIDTGGLGTLYFTLTHIVLTNGYAAVGGGCMMIIFATQVVLDDVTVQNCRSESGGLGGGIYHGFGLLTLKDSRVLSNTAGTGGGIRSERFIVLANTLVAGNRAIAGNGAGGGLDVTFAAVISGSTIFSNTAGANGGGLRVASSTLVSVTNSQINSNSAPAGGGIYNRGNLTVQQTSFAANRSSEGGGINNGISGTLSLLSSTLSGNMATYGGGIYNGYGTVNLTNVTLSGNQASFGGGGMYNFFGTAGLSGVTFNGNSAGSGGGMQNDDGVAMLTNVTLSGNAATNYGGGIVNTSGTATLTNVTLSGNAATNIGGGIFNGYGAVNLTNVTLSGNAATNSGGGIWQNSDMATKTVRLKNTIVANSPSGGNCFKEPSGAPIISDNFNLSSDNSCAPYFNKSADWNNENPNLSPLGNNGGSTLTHVPFPPSKAVDGGSACPSPDQRGVSRPQGIACDIGAVEYVSGEKAPWLFLPLIRR
jgi:hypothetical protein